MKSASSPLKSLWLTVLPLLLSATHTVAQSSPLQVNVGEAKTCSPMTVSWDASKGRAPWTVTVAPLGHVPTNVELSSSYMSGSSTWSWSWDVPRFTGKIEQLIVAVSDATGQVSGTSALIDIASGAGSCAASADESLDFIWYTPKAAPTQCHDWKISFQEDKGNLGLEMPVDILLLPVQGEPQRLHVFSSRASSVDWTVNFPSGTEFAVAAFDQGTSGTGGVGGQTYTVDTSSRTSCLDRTQKEAALGLPSATSKVSQAAATASAATSSGMKTVRHSHTSSAAGPTATKSPNQATSDDEEKSSTHGAAIGGAVGGVIGALVLVGALSWAFIVYRRNRREEDEFFGGKVVKGPHRWSSASDGMRSVVPFTTGRQSPWRQSVQVLAPNKMGRYHNLADDPVMIGNASRSSLNGAPGASVLSHATSVHSVVPDDALFPPPLPVVTRRAPSPDPFSDEQALQVTRRNHPSTRDSKIAIAGLPLPPTQTITRNQPPPPSQPTSQLSFQQTSHSIARIPPPAPASTSLFDPYTHMSQLYSEEEARRIANMVNEEARLTPTHSEVGRISPRYADPKESAARLRHLDEQLLQERKRVVSTASVASSSSGLPYM